MLDTVVVRAVAPSRLTHAMVVTSFFDVRGAPLLRRNLIDDSQRARVPQQRFTAKLADSDPPPVGKEWVALLARPERG